MLFSNKSEVDEVLMVVQTMDHYTHFRPFLLLVVQVLDHYEHFEVLFFIFVEQS